MKNALSDAAANGGNVTLNEDTTVNFAEGAPIAICSEVTIDCNGYKLSVEGLTAGSALFTVNEGAILTLVNAQIDAGAGDLIGTNSGSVVVESTSGAGITTGNFIAENAGSLNIKDGTFHATTEIVGQSTGTIEVQSGIFNSDSSCFDDLYGEATFYDAVVTAGTRGKCFYVCPNGRVEIFGGTYTASDDSIYNRGNVILHAGAAFEATNDSDGCLYSSDGNYEIADDAVASPIEWQCASKVVFVSSIITIRFYSENNLVGEISETPKNRYFPAEPSHSEGAAFCFWADKDGNKVEDLSVLMEDTDLYAVFEDTSYTVCFDDQNGMTTEVVKVNTPLGQVPGLDRKDNGDNFRCWKLGTQIVDENTTMPVQSDLTLTAVYGSKVTNLAELKAAIAARAPAIELGADIELSETVTIDYDCIINGNGYKLLRGNSFANGSLLCVQSNADGGLQKPNLIVKNTTVDGQNIETDTAAIKAEEGTTLILDHVTVENNNNNNDYCSGGGIYAENAYLKLNNCTVQNNTASDSGGGIYAEFDSAEVFFFMSNCTIAENTAEDGGGLYLKGDSNGIIANITDSMIRGNAASNTGGGVGIYNCLLHLYGSTTITENTATEGGGVQSSCGNSAVTCVLYMHDSSRITQNKATVDGGGVHCEELSVVMYDSSSIDHNTASEDGGGVYVSYYGMKQLGGVIRDNQAGGSGGGVYVNSDSYFTAGMMFDNTAAKQGDDLYDSSDLHSLYSQQNARWNGDGNSADLKTVQVEVIPDYYPVAQGSVLVPWYGWFVDGSDGESDRYPGTIAGGTLVSDKNDNMGILTGNPEDVGVKAIWYGLLLAYDANYEGTTEHQYDEQGYVSNADAAVHGNIFERPGYRFVGWNTKKDGSGTNYNAGDTLMMDKSQVLYAQWEKLPDVGALTVSKNVAGDAGEAEREFTFTVKLDDETINGEFGDMTFVNGVATFTLKHNEKKTANGLPADIAYEVTETEANQDGYTTTAANASGRIVKDQTITAAFVNAKNLPDKPTEPPTPDEPTVPPTPDKPTTPDKPETPTEPPYVPPFVPSVPFEPTVPTVPEKPVTPTTPSTSEPPVTPAAPGTPESVVSPAAPGAVSTPDTLVSPAVPGTSELVDSPASSGAVSTPDTLVSPAAPATAGAKVSPAKLLDETPKTEDEMNLGLWFALLAISLLGMAGSFFWMEGKRRSKKHNK